MKNQGIIIAVLVGIAVTVIVLGLDYLRANAKTENIVERNAACVRDAKLKVMGEKVALLEREVAAQSNKADEAEAKFLEEKGANEPLRKQIEKMIGEEIVLTIERDKKKREILEERKQPDVDMDSSTNKAPDMDLN